MDVISPDWTACNILQSTMYESEFNRKLTTIFLEGSNEARFALRRASSKTWALRTTISKGAFFFTLFCSSLTISVSVLSWQSLGQNLAMPMDTYPRCCSYPSRDRQWDGRSSTWCRIVFTSITPPLPTHQSSTLCTLLCHAPLKSSRYRSHNIPWNSFIRTTAACLSCSFTCCSLFAQDNGCLQLFICRVIKYGFSLSIQQLQHEVSQ